MFKKIVLAAGIAASTSAMAQPDVVSMSGHLEEGATITLNGQGFGNFNGEIVSWDDFEGQTVGSRINGSQAKIGGTWTTIYGYNGNGARYDNQRTNSGQAAAHLDWSIDSNTIRAFGWSGKGPYSKLYITYYRNMDGEYLPGTGYNHKQFYLYGTSGGFPQLMPIVMSGGTSWGLYNNVGDSSISFSERNNVNSLGWNYDNTKNKFQRWEIFTSLNDVGVYNGTVKMWVDGKLGVSNERYRTRTVDGQFRDFRLGHMAQGFTSTAKAWFDDLYVATTQARVELCDKPTYSECSQKQIQVADPSVWADGQVSFTLRKGGYQDFDGKYVYVVDENGVANEQGLQLVDLDNLAPPKPPVNVSASEAI